MAVSERDFTKQVVEVARRFGWLVVHFLPARVGAQGRPVTAFLGDGKGFFDIVAIRERVLFAELKIPPNRQTTEQLIWEKQALNAGAEVHVWTPADYDLIVRTFAGVPPAAVSGPG